jgi:hypothetical protein
MFKIIWKFRANVILMLLSLLVTVNVPVQANARPTRTREIQDRARNHIKTKPPVICGIPIIRDVLGWKCPKERQVRSNVR